MDKWIPSKSQQSITHNVPLNNNVSDSESFSMIPRSCFVASNERGLEEEMRVVTKKGCGVVKNIWFGCEEMVDVLMDSGAMLSLGVELDDVRKE